MLLLLIFLLLFANMIISGYISLKSLHNMSKYAGPIYVWFILSIVIFMTPLSITAEIYKKEVKETVVSTIKYLAEH